MNPLDEAWSNHNRSSDRPSPCVSFDGAAVWSIHEMELRDGDRLRVSFEQVDDAKAAQGLDFAVESGAFFADTQVHEELLTRTRLWSDTMPGSVVDQTVVAQRPGDSVFVKVWHVWRWHDRRGADAWIGAYGFRLEERERDLTLRCNAGYAPPDFDDLVATLSVNPEGPEDEARLAELRERGMSSRSGKRRQGSAKHN